MVLPASNPFVTGGNIPLPAPSFTEQGYAPALFQMAQQRAKAAQDATAQVQGQKGLLSSSATTIGLNRSYMDAFDRVMGEFTSQQQLFAGFSRDLIRSRAELGAGQDDLSWWEEALGGALTGAGLGASVAPKGFQGQGAVIGAIGGGLLGAFSDII